jgi:putative transposase
LKHLVADLTLDRPSCRRSSEKTVKPRARCTLAEWAQTTYRLSQRRAARLIPVRIATLRYRLTRDRQDALRQRLRELAAVRVRFGYRRLTVLKREGWRISHKRVYRLYGLEEADHADEAAATTRQPCARSTASCHAPQSALGMDFVSTRLADGHWFRTLTVLDLFTRESLALVVDRSLTGVKVATTLMTTITRHRSAPTSITVDNGTEFVSRAMDAWAHAHDVKLDFIRPGKPVENAFIESFNGPLRDECLNGHVFDSVHAAQHILDTWRDDYNRVRPHSALADQTPEEAAARWGQLTCAT